MVHNPFSKTTNPKQVLRESTEEIREFEKYAKTLKCPSCKHADGFELTSYEKDKKGDYEIHLYCTRCGTDAILNGSGFQFKGMERMIKR